MKRMVLSEISLCMILVKEEKEVEVHGDIPASQASPRYSVAATRGTAYFRMMTI